MTELSWEQHINVAHSLESNYDNKSQVEEVQHPFGCGLLLSAWGPS